MTFTIDIMIKGEYSGLYTPPNYYRCSNEYFREFCKTEFPIMGEDCQKESLYDNFDEDACDAQGEEERLKMKKKGLIK